MRSRSILFNAVILGLCVASFHPQRALGQLMAPDRERIWRSYIPQIDDSVAKVIPRALLYTEQEIPRAYQHQPIGATYTVFFHASAQLNSNPRPTNGNREPPWDRPGGMDKVPKGEVAECRMLILPQDQNGNLRPVVVYKRQLQKSIAVNMPVPTGWGWSFPDGAILLELLVKRFSNGKWAAYEVRMRQRELDDWDVDIFRPFGNFDEFEAALASQGVSVKDSRVSFVSHRDAHPRPAFTSSGITLTLPPVAGAWDLLSKATFKSVTGLDYLVADKFLYPTANDPDNFVPRGYEAHLIGNTRASCINCHQDTLKNVDTFEKPRDWYDFIRGSEGIFSFNPFDPACFGPGELQPFLNRKLEAAGMVAWFDPAKHTPNIYTIPGNYENPVNKSSSPGKIRLERQGPPPRFPGGL